MKAESPLSHALEKNHILSVLYGSINNMEVCLDLLAQGIIKPIVVTEPLKNINQILNDLKASTAKLMGYRVVVYGITTPTAAPTAALTSAPASSPALALALAN
ncbi:hypothetical protein BD414DRAFT_539405 [Trametes punicea]|nr:hypothetical protein BD414DRAFT_539405 [Trametes punicea]